VVEVGGDNFKPAQAHKIKKMENEKHTHFTDAKNYIGFPKIRPQCCGTESYAAGGVLGKRPDGKVGDVEHFWRFPICKKEIIDILA
jgi:hypothetical protein